MASNQPTHPNDLGNVLAQLLQQQQQQQRAQGIAGIVRNVQPVPDDMKQYLAPSSIPSSEQGAGSLSTLVATYLQQAASTSGSGGVAANALLHQPPVAASSFAMNEQQVQQQLEASRLQQLLAAEVLAGINPGLAAAKMGTENASPMDWTLEQLEAYVKQRNDSSQPIPASIVILLDDARRKKEKHDATKMANRKSARCSRSRKKTQIDAIAEDNVRLKRESIILSSIPDPVVAIGIAGDITFANMPMERVLQHKAHDLIGANIETFIAPDSRKQLRKMIKGLVNIKEQAALKEDGEDTEDGEDSGNEYGMDAEGNCGNNSSDSDPNVISLRSSKQASMLMIKVDSGEDISESSGDQLDKKQAYEMNRKSSFGAEVSAGEEKAPPAKKAKLNVDDVMGSSVTANNADAKLSSLHYHKNENKKEDAKSKSPLEKLQPCLRQKLAFSPRISPPLTDDHEDQSTSVDSSSSKIKGRSLNSSDSGYGELHDSPEESNESSSSTMSNTDEDMVTIQKGAVKRTLPLAPASIVCLVRNDLSTVWCELTASSISEEDFDDAFSQKSRASLSDDSSLRRNETTMHNRETKELLICFRPILEGATVGEELLSLRRRTS